MCTLRKQDLRLAVVSHDRTFHSATRNPVLHLHPGRKRGLPERSGENPEPAQSTVAHAGTAQKRLG